MSVPVFALGAAVGFVAGITAFALSTRPVAAQVRAEVVAPVLIQAERPAARRAIVHAEGVTVPTFDVDDCQITCTVNLDPVDKP